MKFLVVFAFLFLFSSTSIFAQYPIKLDSLGMKVSADENREFSYTDKKNAYYYARTHSNFNEEWFAGWNVNTRKVLKDYELLIDGKKLDRMKSEVTVYPNRMKRIYSNSKETLLMFDNRNIVGIKLENVMGENISLKLAGDLHKFESVSEKGFFVIPKEADKDFILVAPWKDMQFKVQNEVISASKDAGGFVFLYASKKDDAVKMLADFRANNGRWYQERMNRMSDLINKNNPLETNDEKMNKVIPWLILTTDQLITNQMGRGIYAGLPWFTDYWGRDMFITMPGACLVTGQFDTAKDVLKSFAKFQNTNRKSKYYGRVPNRANPDGILYNTTDGTPRFVIQILDYVKYSGDTSIIKDLYPNVKRAVNGSLKNWVDRKGYLTHEDADTWMDAKIKNRIPYSPRGNRANDIQSLWVQQLEASAIMAEFMGEPANAKKWRRIARKVKKNFARDFFNSKYEYMADRITARNRKDFKLRPNQLYAYELVNSEEKKMKITKKVWESLVYPWGVASLSQMDKDFHPYHENWNYYHKDSAYHNGTVWLWNNGMAMQRMIEQGQKEIAYKLFENMNYQAFKEGAVGSLSENADALPRDGKKRGKLSGTFLQAWSNAEHIRVLYQQFFGIRPDMLENKITIEPKIPAELTEIKSSVLVGDGKLKYSFKRDEGEIYIFSGENLKTNLIISLPKHKRFSMNLEPNQIIKITVKDSVAEVENSIVVKNTSIKFRVMQDKEKMKKINEKNQFFAGTDFVKPFLQKNLKSLSKFHDPPLTF